MAFRSNKRHESAPKLRGLYLLPLALSPKCAGLDERSRKKMQINFSTKPFLTKHAVKSPSSLADVEVLPHGVFSLAGLYPEVRRDPEKVASTLLLWISLPLVQAQ